MNENCINSNVAIIYHQDAKYPAVAPFHPSVNYPEYLFGKKYLGDKNIPYNMVRECLKMLKMDLNNFGKPTWNPFSGIVKKGDSVVIKPNFVQDYHDTGGELFSVITHGSIIRAIIDYLAIAMEKEGTINIVDAPMMNSNFDKIIDITGLKEVVNFYQKESNIKINIIDLRVMRVDLEDGLVVRRFKLKGDPAGYQIVNLGEKSMFNSLNTLSNKFRGSDYDIEETIKHHNKDRHEYLISKTVLNSDLFINIPKLKTHKKAGVTLSMKNLVGINGDKNWIPHYRIGGPNTSGDEFETRSLIRHIESIVKEEFKKIVFKYNNYKMINIISRKIRKMQKYLVDNYNITPIRAGAWYGNDTIWRSIIDLNIILLHLNRNGIIDRTVKRKYFSLIDGIIGGEKNGPMNPEPKSSRVIIGGFSPLTVDYCAVKLMGFDWNKIPLMKNIISLKEYFGGIDVDKIRVYSNSSKFLNLLDNTITREDTLCFEPPDGWRDHIEL